MMINKDNYKAVDVFAAEWDRTHPMPDDGDIAAWLVRNQAEYVQALNEYLAGLEAGR